MVKPVDLQDNLSKTQILERVQQLQKSSPEEAQKQFVQELQKKVSEGKERVTDTPQSDKIIIHRDGKSKEENQQPKKDKKKQQTDSKTNPDDQGKSSNSKSKIDYIA